MGNPVFSFAADASPVFQKRINELTKQMGQHIDSTLKLSSLGGSIEQPFSAVRDGDVIHLMYPQHVKQGDLLAAVLTAFAAQIPTCVIHESSAGWSEPEWSAETRKHLGGLLLGIESTPKSFAFTTSPADLARISLWITACASALSRPGGVTDAHGDVLPTAVGGQKGASKYMMRLIAQIRSSITDDSCLKAVDTLYMLIKLWQKSKEQEALSIVRKCKLPWSAVLFRAAPTEVIKAKRNRPEQTIVRSPSKPSRSPWLSQAERSVLGDIFKDDWSFLERYRVEWQRLGPEQQHAQMNSYIRRIKAEYERLNAISTSVHAKLGKRKYWIERACKDDGFKPKAKKNESESFLLAQHFFKKDLSTLNIRVKKIFSPVTYLDNDRFSSLDIWAQLVGTADKADNIITREDFSDEDGPSYKLWQVWADYIRPVITKGSQVVDDPPTVESFNIFNALSEKGA
jgi:hypothetical protein